MKGLLFLLITASLVLYSCQKDDEGCDPGQLQTNIVGTWKVSILSLPAGVIEFRANGDLVGDANSLASAFIGPDTLGQKTYIVNSDTSLTFRAQNSTTIQDIDVEVLDYTCNEINLQTPNFQVKMKRKD